MLRRSVVASCVFVLMVCVCFGAMAAGDDAVTGGLLGELPKLKDFKAARQSSYDPSGGNDDGRQDRPIKPGETREYHLEIGILTTAEEIAQFEALVDSIRVKK